MGSLKQVITHHILENQRKKIHYHQFSENRSINRYAVTECRRNASKHIRTKRAAGHVTYFAFKIS